MHVLSIRKKNNLDKKVATIKQECNHPLPVYFGAFRDLFGGATDDTLCICAFCNKRLNYNEYSQNEVVDIRSYCNDIFRGHDKLNADSCTINQAHEIMRRTITPYVIGLFMDLENLPTIDDVRNAIFDLCEEKTYLDDFGSIEITRCETRQQVSKLVKLK